MGSSFGQNSFEGIKNKRDNCSLLYTYSFVLDICEDLIGEAMKIISIIQISAITVMILLFNTCF